MKIRLYSDLHREFDGWEIPEIPNEEEYVLVLAGDIAVARKNNTWLRFLPDAAERHKAVVYVPGNHEYYGGSWDRAWETMTQDWDIPNLHMLNDGAVKVDDVTFIGGTLWTDFNLDGNQTLAMQQAAMYMNDYRVIHRLAMRDAPDELMGTWEYTGKLKPKDTYHAHLGTRAFIDAMLEHTEGKTMVVTHHGPTPQSIATEYHGDKMNPAYVSDLTELIRERAPDVWVHGHTHKTFQYWEGETLVMTNPKGYPGHAVWKGCNSKYENEEFREDGLVPEIDDQLTRERADAEHMAD